VYRALDQHDQAIVSELANPDVRSAPACDS
jgi:hypothetical protein